MVSGTVEKVDAAAGKITIDHGAIPNLNMDAMTMVFRAQDPAMLKDEDPEGPVTSASKSHALSGEGGHAKHGGGRA